MPSRKEEASKKKLSTQKKTNFEACSVRCGSVVIEIQARPSDDNISMSHHAHRYTP